METDSLTSISSNIDFTKARAQLAIITYIVLCIRGCLGWIGIDTVFLTVLLNTLILSCINYRKIKAIFLIVPFLILLMLINKQILALIDLILMCIILQKEEIEKLARIYLIILLCFMPIWLLLLDNGYIENERYFDPAKGGEFFSYGFSNPNGLGMYGFHIMASLFIINNKKHFFILTLACLVINQIFYLISSSRTAWIGGIVLILFGILQKCHFFRNWMKYPLAILPVIITISLIYLSKNCSNYLALDVLTSGRLSIYHSVVSGMSKINYIIGTKLPEGPMDGSYMMLFFYGGFIALTLYFILNFRMMVFHYQAISNYLPFILAIMACGVMETTFSSCGGLSVLYWFLLFNCSRIQNNNLAK